MATDSAGAPPFRVVNEADVERLLPMADAVAVNRTAFVTEHRMHLPSPPHVSMPVTDESGTSMGPSLFKAAHIPKCGLGVKAVSVRSANAVKGLPTVPSVVVVLHEDTGVPRGVVAGTYLTALRTAAGSGAATDAMAPATASSVVVFGAGMQGRAHIAAMRSVRPVSRVVVVNRTLPRAERLAADTAAEEVNGVRCSASAVLLSDADAVREALQAADIVCTCTNADTPLFDGSWLAPGAHINAIGSYTPHMVELDAATVARAKVAVDTMAATEEAGDLARPVADPDSSVTRDTHVVGTLGAVCAGDVDVAAFGTSAQDVTLFKSVGVAIQDVATASAVLDRAEAAGVGTVATL